MADLQRMIRSCAPATALKSFKTRWQITSASSIRGRKARRWIIGLANFRKIRSIIRCCFRRTLSQVERDNLLQGWFNEFLPDLNQAEPEVARYEIQNALWWIAMTGIDGIRQDTIQYMPRQFIRDWSSRDQKAISEILSGRRSFRARLGADGVFSRRKNGLGRRRYKFAERFRFQTVGNLAGSFHRQKAGASAARRFEIRRALSERQSCHDFDEQSRHRPFYVSGRRDARRRDAAHGVYSFRRAVFRSFITAKKSR